MGCGVSVQAESRAVSDPTQATAKLPAAADEAESHRMQELEQALAAMTRRAESAEAAAAAASARCEALEERLR